MFLDDFSWLDNNYKHSNDNNHDNNGNNNDRNNDNIKRGIRFTQESAPIWGKVHYWFTTAKRGFTEMVLLVLSTRYPMIRVMVYIHIYIYIHTYSTHVYIYIHTYSTYVCIYIYIDMIYM